MFNNTTEELFDNVDMGAFNSDGSVGNSPDGLGHHMTPEDMADPNAGPNNDFNVPRSGSSYEPGFNGMYPYGATAGTLQYIEPEDTSPEAASRSAGFTVLLVALSTGIGYAVKGGLGAATGLLISGALANGYRAQKWWGSPDPSEKHEAIVSGIFAGAGLVAGGYVGYRASQEKR